MFIRNSYRQFLYFFITQRGSNQDNFIISIQQNSMIPNFFWEERITL